MKMKNLRIPWSIVLIFSMTALAAFKPRAAEGKTSAGVNVILWFDTEDYLLPADDDATKRLAELLTQRGIRATFKIVGEKARVMEKRGRTDVIAALKKHDIGYHANFHSVHPTPSEYLADCGLLDGMAEFIRREGGGAADVRRILSVPTLACYGQPGSSWGAQAIAALRQIGVAPHGTPCYVDEGDHVGLGGKPFWYAGALVVYNMRENWTRMDLHNDASVEPAKQKVSGIAERLKRENAPGLISIYYHPCEWVHREFWDGVNFARGANPPREEWKPPGQLPPEETEAAFKRFEKYIDHIRSIPGLRFVTAGDLPGVYPDRTRTIGATENELHQLSEKIVGNADKGIDFETIGGKSFSLADQFALLESAVSQSIEGKGIQFPIPAPDLLGPDSPPSVVTSNSEIPWRAFREAALDVRAYLRTQGRIPARVFIGPDAVAPADFLVGLANAYLSREEIKQSNWQKRIKLGKDIEILPARHVAKDTPNLFGGWVIHRVGFRAPKILEVARLQAWTLKPAIAKAD